MKYILAFLVVLFLASPVFAQSASDQLRVLPEVAAAASLMSPAEIDAMLEMAKRIIREQEKNDAQAAAMNAIDKKLREDPALMKQLIAE